MSRALQKLTSKGTYIAQELSGYAGWAVPGALAAGWMIWPGLTQSFKEETLGLKSSPAPGSAATAQTFAAVGKYKYVRNEVGERPTLEEE